MAQRTKNRRKSGGKAVGAYLRTLREDAELTTTEVAARIQTHPTQIWRIETWQSDISSSLLLAYVRAIGGNVLDIEHLMNNPDANVHDGENLARKYLRYKEQPT
jgi:hypothetical protein